ncbi:MAG: gamma-butyrobetaine hydroxylase [Planctomycetota bacterium]|jgi:gamma-butyrobetaine hydroxylase
MHPVNIVNLNTAAAESIRANSIKSITRENRTLILLWADGHQSEFHNIWLRDNCRCSECGDRSGGHRYLELLDIDDNIEPATADVSQDGSLTIRWKNNDHLTEYPANWLRQHCYSAGAIKQRRAQPQLWDADIKQNLPVWDYQQIIDDEMLRRQTFERINNFGFAIIDNVPNHQQQIERLADIFGFIRETHYGRVFELLATPQQRILAQTSHAIRPHTDEQFRAPVPGLFMMHCLRASECGGGASILVDGFNAAEKLRLEQPEYFELLSQIPIPHRRFLHDEVDNVALSAKWPSIELDRYGDLKAVHINERTMAPLDVEADLVEPVYRALKALLSLLYAPEAQLHYRLESGQAVVLDNHRVLHARTAFNGNRHIRQCHVDRDELFSRMRVLQNRPQ